MAGFPIYWFLGYMVFYTMATLGMDFPDDPNL